MEHLQYPSTATVNAFGGISAMSRALKVGTSTVQRWKTANTGYIPRWRTRAIHDAAVTFGIKLPRPRRVRN